MSDQKQGGIEWELGEAESAIVAAGDDPVARAVAFRRHAEAIRNMMQGALVPSFVSIVERVLSGKIDPVAEAITGLRADVLAAAAESARRLGKQDKNIAALAVRVSALEANNVRLEALEDAIAALRAASVAERHHGE